MTSAAVESKNGTAEQSRMKFLRWSAMRSSTVPTVEAAPKKKAPENPEWLFPTRNGHFCGKVMAPRHGRSESFDLSFRPSSLIAPYQLIGQRGIRKHITKD